MTSYPAATWCLLPATVHTRACVCVRARLAPPSTKGANDGHPTSLALLSFAAASALEFRLVFGSSPPVRSRDDTEDIARLHELPAGRTLLQAMVAFVMSGHRFRSAYTGIHQKKNCWSMDTFK